MKIGFFTNTYLPISYGATVSVEYFRKGLEALGHQVFVFAPSFPDFEDENERVFRYPSFPWKYKIKYPLGISYWPAMNGKVRKLDLDIVHCHQPFSIGKDGLRQAKRNGLPVVFTHHCRYEEYIHYIPPVLPKNFLKRYVKKRATIFANKCDQIIAPSETVKRMIEKRGVKKPIEVLPTGIDWEKFQKGEGRKIRQKFFVKDDEILLINVGRMEEEKNIFFLFDAVNDLIEKRKNVKMLFVGEGSLKKEFQEKVNRTGLREKIFFAGLISQNEIADYYSAGDIFLHTSKSETQGMTINEAMAGGLPIVAIEASGIADVMDDGKNGLMTKDSSDDFRQAVLKLIEDMALRDKIGQGAREKAKEIDYHLQTKKVEKIYFGLANNFLE